MDDHACTYRVHACVCTDTRLSENRGRNSSFYPPSSSPAEMTRITEIMNKFAPISPHKPHENGRNGLPRTSANVSAFSSSFSTRKNLSCASAGRKAVCCRRVSRIQKAPIAMSNFPALEIHLHWYGVVKWLQRHLLQRQQLQLATFLPLAHEQHSR